MGTTWSLRVTGPISKDCGAQIQNFLAEQEAILSHWRQDSAVSRFNQSQSTDWFPVPAIVVEAVALAKDIADQTEGALDITIAPLIDLWGFGANPPAERRVPTAAQIAEARQHCGWQHLHWRMDPPALRKAQPQLQINVAAITEGLVADKLTGMLSAQGVHHFLLNLGGEIVARGLSPEARPWRVGIQTPHAPQGETLEAVSLTNEALATSGIYRQFFEASGKTYPHLINPKTAQPIEHELESVSVIHPRCALADGYATALMILGPNQGKKTARKLSLQAVWIEP